LFLKLAFLMPAELFLKRYFLMPVESFLKLRVPDAAELFLHEADRV
jgi:hypothetical protein